MSELRIAVVGAGHLGTFHARRMAEVQGLRLAAIVEPLDSRRRQAAHEFQVPVLASHRDLPATIDAAVVATPTRWHRDVALELIRRGIHVLVEKPLAATAGEAAELVEAARAHRVVLQVGHVERFNPAWTAALPHLEQPKYVEAVRAGGFSFRSTDVGVVLDLMIHDIDLLLSLVASPVVRVEALGVSLFGRHEDVANARLVFANGCVAALSASRASRAPRRTMQVWSRRAMTTIDFHSREVSVIRPSEAVLARRLDVAALAPAEQARLKDCLLQEHLPQERIETPACDAIAAELGDFADSVRSSRAPRVSGAQAQSAIEVAEQILDSLAAWDGAAEESAGARGVPVRPPIIPAPHWLARPAAAVRREAG